LECGVFDRRYLAPHRNPVAAADLKKAVLCVVPFEAELEKLTKPFAFLPFSLHSALEVSPSESF
jgi:hypothetical protein